MLHIADANFQVVETDENNTLSAQIEITVPAPNLQTISLSTNSSSVNIMGSKTVSYSV